jgi:hypothetical protein
MFSVQGRKDWHVARREVLRNAKNTLVEEA